MTISIHGLVVSRGVAIGRAVLISSHHADAQHYFIRPEDITSELLRLTQARDAAAEELVRILQHANEWEKEAPHELRALLDAHLMLIKDPTLIEETSHWISDRFYNAEWALVSQFEVIERQFEEMDDEYLRERVLDLGQILDCILRAMRGAPTRVTEDLAEKANRKNPKHQDLQLSDSLDTPLILIARDISPADMLTFKNSVFAGFVTDVGGQTSHTAIVARSMDIPAVVGTRCGSQIIRQDDWIIIDGDAGVVIIDPAQQMLDEYSVKKRQVELNQARLQGFRNKPAVTLDGQAIMLQANIELPSDAAEARRAGAMGVGLFRSEFLFMGRRDNLPDEEEQYLAYKEAVDGMKGLPVTIRTVDIGMDKTLDGDFIREEGKENSALGLRAIRWSLVDPAMFLTQLRAILRASHWGLVKILIPLLSHIKEINQTLAYIQQAKAELFAKGIPFNEAIQIGAMIEVPASAILSSIFVKRFDFLSIGTNDLIQYTLAIDRTDESVAHLYDPLHPAVLMLIAQTIATAKMAGKEVSVCGEMAGDIKLTKLFLGLGLRNFSMHPSQILAVKREILLADTTTLICWAEQVLSAENPSSMM